VCQPKGFLPFGIDYHALSHRRSASCNWLIFAFYLHKAEAASGKRLFPFPDGAKVWYVDIIIYCYP